MASGQLNVAKTTQGGGKKKNKTSKNVFNLGFDPGFTKVLLKTPSKIQSIKSQSQEKKKKKISKKK
jgi:hypothetical protein